MIYNYMQRPNEDNLDEIKHSVRCCLKKLYSQDNILFERNEGEGLCERCIVFRLSLYLQERFRNYFVDCDFNSSSVNRQEKTGKPITNANGQTSTKRFVDIIIHKRTFDSTNDFICFEVKKWNNYNSRATRKDKNNLKVLTEEYGYKYGFYLIFGKNLIKTKWIIFKNGDIFEGKTHVFQNE